MRALLFFFLSCTAIWSQEILSKTTHEIVLESGPLVYTAIVSSMPTRDQAGKVTGHIIYTAYHKEGATDRPITFAVNGGPGSSSVWLHLGAFGPKRVHNIEENQSLVPPYRWIENRDSILDLTDLVFIDPLGTGFSRPADETDTQTLYSIEGDIACLGDFIADYVTRENRWTSPKYLAGESYGTHRVSGLSSYLIEEHGMLVNGLILISCAIDYQTFVSDGSNEIPYSLVLPSYAATAWYYGRLDSSLTLEMAVDQAREFALEPFARGLWREGFVPKELYPQLSYWTGLPLSLLEEREGLIDELTFSNEFLAKEKKAVGFYDSRHTHVLPPYHLKDYYAQLAWDSCEIPFTAVLQSYLCNELEYKVDWPRYEILSHTVHRQWNYQNLGYPNRLDSLRKSLLCNPEMRIFVAAGYFDLVTPFAAAEHSFKRLRLPLKEHPVRFAYYEGGHMFYSNPQALKKFKTDLTQFFNQGTQCN